MRIPGEVAGATVVAATTRHFGKLDVLVNNAVIRQDGAIVGEHMRSFGRNQTIYDPWHYVPVLARKPGALRNGAPFKDWLLPAHLERVRRRLKGSDDGDRQMVKILSAVLSMLYKGAANILQLGVLHCDLYPEMARL